MSYLSTPAESPLYDADVDRQGHVANYTRVFALAPAAYAAWAELGESIKGGMDLRRFELVTLAAARALRSTYCAMAHGAVLRDWFHDAETVARIAVNHRDAGLDPVDVAVMDLAEKVATDATRVSQADVDRLRDLGLDDTDVLQVVLAAAARCFFSKVLDGVGAEPDAIYRTSLEPDLRAVLTVGRPIEVRNDQVGDIEGAVHA
jgi:uncharacterized peroxidase-related enzyme